MRLSQYFLPLLKETPKEAEIVSHQLMLRAGMIKQQAAGSYSWLPLGFKVLQKVVRIIEEEQNRAGAIELLMPTLQLMRSAGRSRMVRAGNPSSWHCPARPRFCRSTLARRAATTGHTPVGRVASTQCEMELP